MRASKPAGEILTLSKPPMRRRVEWGRTSLPTFFTHEWWPGTGSNRRRRPFQGRALPLSYLAAGRDPARKGVVRGASAKAAALTQQPQQV